MEGIWNRQKRCSCGGIVKKGVFDRVEELSNFDIPHHPSHRSPYRYLIPLAEIISSAVSSGVNTKKVNDIFNKLLGRFGNELSLVFNVPLSEISEVSYEVAVAIEAFRTNKIKIIPGGGGMYGRIEIPPEEDCLKGHAKTNNEPKGKHTLFDF